MSSSLSPPKTTSRARNATTGSSIFKNALSSTAGAAVTATVVTPLDVVKVRLQAHVCPVGGHLTCEDPQHVSTSIEAMRNIIRNDGFKGLWRGLNITLLLAIPTTGIYFTLYEIFKQQYTNRYEKYNNDWLKNASCGASARILAATIASPLELARTNIQAGLGNDIWNILRNVRHQQGIRGWWSGLGPTLIRDAPFSAIYWSVYEGLKVPINNQLHKQFNVRHNQNTKTTADITTYLTSGVGAGALAAFCTIPADVVKTRRQTSFTRSNSGSLNIVKEIYQSEGIRGLFKGTGPRVAKVAPACALMMGSFETFKKLLG